MAAEAIVSFVVERLGNLLVEEAKFLYGVGGQVQEIQDDLRWMQGFLKDAYASKIEREGIRNWVADVRELAYDAEDVLESYVVKRRRKGGTGIQNILRRYVCILNKCIPLHKVGSDIQDIKTRISQLTTRVQAFNIIGTSTKGEGSSESRQHQLRQTYPHVVEEDFVGLEGDVEDLVAQLLNNYYGVVSICGMGGLGKTTLAQKIYNHTEIKSHFEGGLAWVCISQEWQKRDVLQRILSKLEPERKGVIMNLHEDDLVEQLYKVQQAKRCLVVLDDIWDRDAWHCVRPGFPIGKEGSKILVTTRNEEVAREVDPHGYIHKPRFLSEDEGWVLLQKKALPKRDGTGHKVNNEMEQKGRQMVRRCGGLPLAIVVLGGILVNRHTLMEWEMVYESMSSYLRKGEGTGQEHAGIQHVLNLSYDELPPQLKPCFLYLGHFLEDYEISAEKLCHLWIAEGIICSKDRGEGEAMMDVAERYLGELAQRSMVQIKLTSNLVESDIYTIWSRTRRFEYCRLHDLVRELCILKGKEEDFVKVISFLRHANESSIALSPTSQSVRKQRRLAIYLDGDDSHALPKHQETSPHIRSLLFFIPKTDLEFT